MKRQNLILIVLISIFALWGCQGVMNTHLIRDIPSGTYKVTLVESDHGCLNHFGNNCIVLFDVSDDRDLQLVYGGAKKELGDVPSNSVDGRGLIFYSITNDNGHVLGYLGFSEGQRAIRSTVFDNGSVVVGRERIEGDGSERRCFPICP